MMVRKLASLDEIQTKTYSLFKTCLWLLFGQFVHFSLVIHLKFSLRDILSYTTMAPWHDIAYVC